MVFFIQNRDGFRHKEQLFPILKNLKNRVRIFGSTGTQIPGCDPEYFLDFLVSRCINSAFRLQIKQPLRRIIGQLDLSVRAADGNRVGEAFQRQLRGILRAQQTRMIVPSQIAQAQRHFIKCFSQLSHLVPRLHVDDKVQISLLNFLHGAHQAGNGPKDGRPDQRDEDNRQGKARKNQNQQGPPGLNGANARLTIHGNHIVQVQINDLLGRVAEFIRLDQDLIAKYIPARKFRIQRLQKAFEFLAVSLPLIGHAVGQRLLPEDGHIPLLELQAFFKIEEEDLALRMCFFWNFPNGCHGDAIQPLDGTLHFITGDHAVIVLPKNPFYGFAEVIRRAYAHHADDQQNRQQAAETDDQFRLQAHHFLSLLNRNIENASRMPASDKL